MWFVYIIECQDKSLYTGCTKDLERRFAQHSQGKGGKYTFSHKPVKIVFSEKCRTQSRALKREIEIKSWTREQKVNFIENQKPG